MNNLCKSLILFVFAIASFWNVSAQEGQKELVLSLEECVRIALERSNRVIQGRLTRDFGDTGIDQARASFLPILNANWGTSNSVNGPRNAFFIDEATGSLVQSVGQSTTSGAQNVGASISMSLFNATSLANLSAAKNTFRANQLDLDASEDQVAFEAKREYYRLLQSMSLLEVQQEQVRVDEESLRRAETLNEIGSSPISQVFSAKAVLEGNKAQLILRENDVEISRSDLAFTLGMTADVRIIPTEVEIKIEPVGLTFEKAYDVASQGSALAADRYDMLRTKDNLKATRYQLYAPTISMTGSYSWNLSDEEDFGGLEDLFLRNYSYNVRLNVSVPIFNMVTTTSVKRQKIQYLQQMEIYQQSKRQLGLNIRRALLNIRQLVRSIQANEASVVAQEQDFRLQDEAYNFGAGTFLDRQQAQLRLFNAKSALVRARYNYQIEIADLERLLGMPVAEALKR
jgi:outer membrane protein